MTIINGHVLSKDEEREREELLSTSFNKPGTKYAITSSGILAPIPDDAEDRKSFIENNMRVDGADTFYGGYYDAVNDG